MSRTPPTLWTLSAKLTCQIYLFEVLTGMFRALPSQAIAYYLWVVVDRVGITRERFRELMERKDMYMKKVVFDGLNSCNSASLDTEAWWTGLGGCGWG